MRPYRIQISQSVWDRLGPLAAPAVDYLLAQVGRVALSVGGHTPVPAPPSGEPSAAASLRRFVVHVDVAGTSFVATLNVDDAARTVVVERLDPFSDEAGRAPGR